MHKKLRNLTTTATLFLLNAQVAFAAGTGGGIPAMEQPVTTVANSMTGPIAHGFILSSIVLGGITYMFTDHGTGARQVTKIAMGGGITGGAVQVAGSLFGLGGALF